MKILLSAFACQPDRGSEPGVGWNWAITLARMGHSVTVLTHSRNREAIEVACHVAQPEQLQFTYLTLFSDGAVPGTWYWHYLYYHFWQLKALLVLIKTRAWRRFDVLHHLTYGGVRTGSLLFILPKPFVFGPVGGGETCPLSVVAALGIGALMTELGRRISNRLSYLDPVFVLMQLRAGSIFVKTRDTKRLILPSFRYKTVVSIEIGCSGIRSLRAREAPPGPFRILAASRLLYWKGLDILADAMAILDSRGASFSLKIAGDGPHRGNLQSKLGGLRNSTAVLLGHVRQSVLFDLYSEADVFVFPSLHDSSGNVVLEAMSFGLPVICLDLGGPPLVLGEAGIVIAVEGKSYADICASLAEAIYTVARSPSFRRKLTQMSVQRAHELSWEAAVSAVYNTCYLYNVARDSHCYSP